MKSFEEREAIISQKIRAGKRRRAAIGSGCVALVLALALVLFLPYDRSAPSVRQYESSDYYALIQALSAYAYTPSPYANNFEAIRGAISSAAEAIDGTGTATDGYTYSALASEIGASGYVEVTDNQVSGVIEGDLVKHSTDTIYYLRGETLYLYDALLESTGEAAWLASCDWAALAGINAVDDAQLYLSSDSGSVVIVCTGAAPGEQTMVHLVTLDVTDAENITLQALTSIPGSYLSSRMVDDQILLLSKYNLSKSALDYDALETYVPCYYQNGEKQYLPADEIYFPDNLIYLRYTVLTFVDAATGSVSDAAAFLSYSGAEYVSGEHVYLTTSGSCEQELADGSIYYQTTTDIACVAYGDEGLTSLGMLTVPGSVLNSYSLDESGGVLRLVTTTEHYIRDEDSSDYLNWVESASLHCYELGTWEEIASVEDFAPNGESVQSVRFDGDALYVCTAIEVTDPVFFFDLSDYSSITYTQTEEIDGYSSSLVSLGDGLLLGIGYNGDALLKLEVYAETEEGVQSLASYEPAVISFSEDYKAYYINRDYNMVGLAGLYDDGVTRYILVFFDGYELREWRMIEMEACDVDTVRGVLVGNTFFLLSDRQCIVEPLLDE